MEAALLTIGDELLAGDIENTNATWLARQLAARGVALERITTVPDDVDVVASHVRRYSERFDVVLCTGGLGGTPDDMTMESVAAAFDRDLVVDEAAREDIERTVAAIADEYPNIDVNVERHASLPEGARPLLNGEGLSPGCVVENVYVFPGIPREMKAMFADVVEAFGGDLQSRTLLTPLPEAEVTPTLEAARDDLPEVVLGSYPSRRGVPNRVKITGERAADLDRAEAWLRERIEVHDEEEAEREA
ncbi:competence/damage-inducible protein A [Halomarina ordinaria]|uniref:Competence/damage-inducible protein A n=1 Tax=Halomarina ordinaria TaxID=3033939 RepID=A0ABD5UD91_9EURY|nr:molybdopterin-binding protein [Halomarina sp. PSRA2]